MRFVFGKDRRKKMSDILSGAGLIIFALVVVPGFLGKEISIAASIVGAITMMALFALSIIILGGE